MDRINLVQEVSNESQERTTAPMPEFEMRGGNTDRKRTCSYRLESYLLLRSEDDEALRAPKTYQENGTHAGICCPTQAQAAGVAGERCLLMIVRKGRVYRCQNSRCGAELKIERESIDGFSNPICCCGAEMARRYDAPAFKRLECSPEVIALLKLLAELNGFELLDRAGAEGRIKLTDVGETLQPAIAPRAVPAPPAEASHPLPLVQVRDLYVQRVLEMCHGNRARAAQVLGIGRNSLYRILKRIRESDQTAIEPRRVQGRRILLSLLSDRQ